MSYGADATLTSDSQALSNLPANARAGLATNPPAKIQRGLEALHWFSQRALAATTEVERATSMRQIPEIIAALENNHRSPVPRRIDVLQLPFVHYRYISGRVGLGATPATNLQPVHQPERRATLSSARCADTLSTSKRLSDSRRGEDTTALPDPLPSTFWSPPINIAAHDLALGFGRTNRPAFEDALWTYTKPKDGFGAHPGFEVESGGQRLKIKFGELQSEPFAARIFHALGFNVDASDYSPGLKVKYDRRIFTEFNSRKPVDTRITALGVLPIWTIHFQPSHDPFEHIAAAVLKDGTTLTATELRTALQSEPASTNFEERIVHLVTAPANVQLRNPHEKSIGPWDFGQLGHENLRELRGAGLVAAWLGWFDSRFENTRLRVVKRGDGFELKHVFADVGGGLGKSVGWSGWRGEVPEEFPDSFTEPEIFQGRGRMTIPFRIVNFRPIEPTPAFREMTLDDARWMARRMAQLSEQQLADALRASGFEEANVELYSRKLLARREKMLRDLKMESAR